jgi:acyl carrier protein
MSIEHIYPRIVTVITERVNRAVVPAQVTLDARLRDDLGLDSLCASELIFEIQEEFGTVVTDEDVSRFQTVRDLVRAIDQQTAAF